MMRPIKRKRAGVDNNPDLLGISSTLPTFSHLTTDLPIHSCPFDGCSSSYTNYGSLKAHISRLHRHQKNKLSQIQSLDVSATPIGEEKSIVNSNDASNNNDEEGGNIQSTLSLPIIISPPSPSSTAASEQDSNPADNISINAEMDSKTDIEASDDETSHKKRKESHNQSQDDIHLSSSFSRHSCQYNCGASYVQSTSLYTHYWTKHPKQFADLQKKKKKFPEKDINKRGKLQINTTNGRKFRTNDNEPLSSSDISPPLTDNDNEQDVNVSVSALPPMKRKYVRKKKPTGDEDIHLDSTVNGSSIKRRNSTASPNISIKVTNEDDIEEAAAILLAPAQTKKPSPITIETSRPPNPHSNKSNSSKLSPALLIDPSSPTFLAHLSSLFATAKWLQRPSLSYSARLHQAYRLANTDKKKQMRDAGYIPREPTRRGGQDLRGKRHGDNDMDDNTHFNNHTTNINTHKQNHTHSTNRTNHSNNLRAPLTEERKLSKKTFNFPFSPAGRSMTPLSHSFRYGRAGKEKSRSIKLIGSGSSSEDDDDDNHMTSKSPLSTASPGSEFDFDSFDITMMQDPSDESLDEDIEEYERKAKARLKNEIKEMPEIKLNEEMLEYISDDYDDDEGQVTEYSLNNSIIKISNSNDNKEYKDIMNNDSKSSILHNISTMSKVNESIEKLHMSSKQHQQLDVKATQNNNHNHNNINSSNHTNSVTDTIINNIQTKRNILKDHNIIDNDIVNHINSDMIKQENLWVIQNPTEDTISTIKEEIKNKTTDESTISNNQNNDNVLKNELNEHIDIPLKQFPAVAVAV